MKIIGRIYNRKPMVGFFISSRLIFMISKFILIFPIIFASVIPQGYMPTISQSDKFTISICTNFGIKDITLDANGNPVSADGNSEINLCAFGNFSLLAILINNQFLNHTIIWHDEAIAVVSQYISLIFNAENAPRAPPFPI